MKFIGIDFSLSSPAVCRYDDSKEWSYENCEFFFLTGNRKMEILDRNIHYDLFKPYTTDTERFLLNAHALKNWIKPDSESVIHIEGYAFGARGSRIFQIGEATGMLKTLLIHDSDGKLINNGMNLHAVSPPTVKKFATGKGNANKEKMVESFVEETSVDLIERFNFKKLKSPIHDLVDAFWLCKRAFVLHSETK